MKPDPAAIDAVYTWVDGGQPDYQDLVAEFSHTSVDRNPERTRDEHQLLRYSLRSLRKYAPWIRNVVLFTFRSQVPQWLDIENPRLRVVHHDEIIDPKYLPTFNCSAIESYLGALPTSSDTFLYLNDDFLFGAATDLEDFFRDGRIQVMGTLFGERLPFRIYFEKYLCYSFGLGHTPMLVHKPFWETMLQGYAEEVEKTRTSRFRLPESLQMDRLYNYFHLSRPEIPTRAVSIFELRRFHRFIRLTNEVANQRQQLEALKTAAPKFYCLNDDQGDAANPEVTRIVREMLEAWYPEKCDLER